MWKDHAHFNAELLEVRDTNTLLNYGPHTHSLGSWRNQTSSCFIYSIISIFNYASNLKGERAEISVAQKLRSCVHFSLFFHKNLYSPTRIHALFTCEKSTKIFLWEHCLFAAVNFTLSHLQITSVIWCNYKYACILRDKIVRALISS